MIKNFLNKKNILKHSPLDDAYPDIKPSKNFIPDWYKKTERLNLNCGTKSANILPLPLTMKACPAFMDSFTTGYMITLPVDIAVKQTEQGPIVSWTDSSSKYLELRDKNLNELLPTPLGFSDHHFTWITKHIIEVPEGYSFLYTHPLNRYDLPFLTLSGIADGHTILQQGNVPVYFSKTFEGIIPCDTPIIQIIPFKREKWSSEKDKTLIEKGNLAFRKSDNRAFGYYKQNFWKKKVYE